MRKQKDTILALKQDYTPDFSVYGIVTGLTLHRLVYFVNKACHTQFARQIADLDWMHPQHDLLLFPIFTHQNKKRNQTWHIIEQYYSNEHNPLGDLGIFRTNPYSDENIFVTLLSKYKSTPFLLILKDPTDKIARKFITQEIAAIPGVNSLFSIDLKSIGADVEHIILD